MAEKTKKFLDNIKSKFNNPDKLCFIFYGATALVILSRLFSFLFNMRMLNPLPGWASWEYTIAFLLPLAGYSYFINSKYAEDEIYGNYKLRTEWQDLKREINKYKNTSEMVNEAVEKYSLDLFGLQVEDDEDDEDYDLDEDELGDE